MNVIRVFFVGFDFEKSNITLPYDGGLMQQPYKTLEVWRVIRTEYQKKLSADAERMKRKGSKR